MRSTVVHRAQLSLSLFAVALLLENTAALNAAENYRAVAKAAISVTRYEQSVSHLAREVMGGRAVGTPESRKAIEFIASTFELIGLQPAQGNYLQEYDHEYEGVAKAANVIGLLPGNHPDLKNEAVIITAHHDHLGRRKHDGCPNERLGKCIKPGANDNASGVAGLIELAYALHAVKDEIRRTVIFATMDGEECGCTGSNHYVFRDPVHPISRTVYALNIDSIGKGGSLEIYKADTHHSAGENCENDGEVFARKGIPAASLIGDNPDYHLCTDTVAGIDFEKAVSTVRHALDLVLKAVQN